MKKMRESEMIDSKKTTLRTKSVIVTGASGFLGYYVVKKLEQKYWVVTFSRKNMTYGDKHILVDLCDEKALEDILWTDIVDEMEEEYLLDEFIIVHLAADTSVPGDSLSGARNLLMTENILRWARKNQCKKFIQISSVPVIGEIIETPITEKHPILPITPYHMSKYQCELVAIRIGENCGMTIYNLRISSPVGVGMNPKRYLSALVEKARRNEIIEVYGKGLRIQNYIDVRDVADGIFLAIESEEKSTGLYLIGGESVSNIKLAKMCVEVCKSKSEIIIGKRCDPEEKNKWILDTSLARKQLGFVPRYTLRDTIEWLLRMGNE